MTKAELEMSIKVAFANVKLDGGVSLRQTQVMSNYGEGVTNEEFAALPNYEITDDWTAIPFEELERYCNCTAHLDEKGFRYYIPAFMLASLDEPYEIAEWISYSLSPNTDNNDLWNYSIMHYSLLNEAQRSAIAQFLHWFPRIHDLELRNRDDEVFKEALRSYWHQFL